MKRFLVLTICIMALVAMGCGSDSKKAATPAKEQKTVQLAAAASLEKVFEQQLIPMFNKKHPEIKIQGVYDASGDGHWNELTALLDETVRDWGAAAEMIKT